VVKATTPVQGLTGEYEGRVGTQEGGTFGKRFFAQCAQPSTCSP
jgi:hypothetical protein